MEMYKKVEKKIITLNIVLKKIELFVLKIKI